MATATRPTARPARASTRTKPAGIIRAVVAVTGVEDEVGDIIQPGIFPASYTKRKPKVVFHHKFDDFAGRVEEIEELMPLDPRLPKKQPNGQPWPAAAGALITTMQFNLNTTRGAEVYEWARFYAETGEAAWSIGYQVPRGMSAKRGGIRYIYGIDLFEVSLVLHGAHPLTMALEVKSAAAAVDRARHVTPGLEFKEVPHSLPLAKTPNEGVMVALYPDPDTAKSLAVAGGESADELHVTLAYLGKKSKLPASVEDIVTAVKSALQGHGPLAGQVGGLGIFPDSGDGTPVWAPVDVPGLETVRESIVAALDGHGPTAGAVARDHGYTPHMTLGYDLPQVAPTAPTPVSFGEAVVVYGDERHPVPFGGGAPAAPGTPTIETKAAHRALAAARSLPPMEVKAMQQMPGSYEDRQRQLSSALQKRFAKKKHKDRHDIGGCPWVGTEATFDDHVIATVHDDDSGQDKTFSLPYTWDGAEVSLGDPIEVELTVVPAAGVPVTATVPSVGERVLEPAFQQISTTAAAIAALPFEAKNIPALRPALYEFIDALYKKGVDVAGLALGDDGDLEAQEVHDAPAAPAAPADAPLDDDDLDELDDENDLDIASLNLEGLNLEDDDLDDDPEEASEPLDDDPEEPLQDEGEPGDDIDRVSVDPAEIAREMAELRG